MGPAIMALSEAGANLSIGGGDDGYTPLHVAAAAGHVAAVSALLMVTTTMGSLAAPQLLVAHQPTTRVLGTTYSVVQRQMWAMMRQEPRRLR